MKDSVIIMFFPCMLSVRVALAAGGIVLDIRVKEGVGPAPIAIVESGNAMLVALAIPAASLEAVIPIALLVCSLVADDIERSDEELAEGSSVIAAVVAAAETRLVCRLCRIRLRGSYFFAAPDATIDEDEALSPNKAANSRYRIIRKMCSRSCCNRCRALNPPEKIS